MATLATLRASVRLVLAGDTDWPDASLNDWIRDAIRLYSQTYPRMRLYSLSLTTGTQAYALPGAHDISGIVSVEYPAGQTPKQWLLRAGSERDAEFASGLDVYALRAPADTVATTADTTPAWIVFAPTVTTGETATIQYMTAHASPTSDTDVITVPGPHHEAITAYCRFRSFTELESDQAITVDTTNVSIVLAQLGQAARAAWRAYQQVMASLMPYGPDQGGVAVDWQDIGGVGRVY